MTWSLEADCPGAGPSQHPSDLTPILGELHRRLALIGRGDGPYRTAEGRRAELRFWLGLGPPAAAWLVDRLAEPREVRIQYAIADLLADMAEVSVDPILRALEGRPTTDQADHLLSTLPNLPAERIARQPERLSGVLARYLRHRDDMVRLHAVEATAVLSPGTARRLLQDVLDHETDDEVRTRIEEVLEERSHV